MEKSDPIKKQIELNSLIEFSQLVNSNLELDFIFGNILLSIMGKMMILKGMFLIKNQNKNNNSYIIKTVKGLNQKLKNQEIEFEFPRLSIFSSEDFYNKDNFFINNNFNYFFKIFFTNKLLGVLCLGKKIGNTLITKEETVFIETILNISAPAIDNSLKFNEIRILNENLNIQINQLKSLFELSKELNSNFQDKNKIIRLLNYTLLGNFGVKDLLIFSKFRSDKFYLLNSKNDIFIDNEFLNSLEEINDTILINNISKNYAINFLSKKNYKLVLPIKNNGKVESIVCLGNRLNKKEFTQEDLQYLESILNLCIISLDNTVLFNEFIEKQKIENELKIAREMQEALLPKILPDIKNYQISAINIPALQVGGDYYDIIRLSNSKYAIAIADVSGKGTPASLLMSNIQSAIHSFLKLYDENNFNLIDVTKKINELIYENTTVEKFITFFWGILDSEKHTFTYINAGHNPPLHLSKNGITSLDKGGLMLGVMQNDVIYESGQIFLNDNDIIIFYTDGVTEAVNFNNEEFGEKRLHNTSIANLDKSSDELIQIINNEINLFAKGLAQHDDITLIVLKKKQ